jgi:NAD-dependent dihydropyrimidine dehydrogenase PreA subunit
MKQNGTTLRYFRWTWLTLTLSLLIAGFLTSSCDSLGRAYQTFTINQDSCVRCLKCVPKCNYGAIRHIDVEGDWDSVVIDPKKCVGCGECLRACPTSGAIQEKD